MRALLSHAAHLGVSVHMAHLPHPYRGFYDHQNARIVYDFGLTPIERRCVLAHELGHAFHGHTGRGVPEQEKAADRYAAHLLIDPERYAHLERVYEAPSTIAEELGVEPHLLQAFRQSLTQMGGSTYLRAGFGRGQFLHRWDAETR